MKISIEAIPAFSDNYIWLLSGEDTSCGVVDPGESAPVLETLRDRKLDLKYILLTHHHYDHIDGAQTLISEFPEVTVYGPEDNRINFDHIECHEGDVIDLNALGLEFGVLEVPAHTRSHIAFFGHELLFSGDTLFSVGCGKLFEGTPEQMQSAMDKFSALPPGTRIYCGHEYTLSNCEFALQVEPDNQALQTRKNEAKRLREEEKITLPAILQNELEVNPFMRTREKAVVEAARKIDPSAQPGSQVMAVIRRWKDQN